MACARSLSVTSERSPMPVVDGGCARELQLAELLAASGLGLHRLDIDAKTLVLPSAVQMREWAARDAAGRACGSICSADHGTLMASLRDALVGGAGRWTGEYRSQATNAADPAPRWWLAVGRIEAHNTGWYVDLVVREITAERHAGHVATHDALTGLPNRAMFARLMQRAIEARQASARPFALMFLDLDRFKVINDTLGHAAGDELLRRMADRFVRSVGAEDVVARLGGDEFVVLVDAPAHSQQVADLAQALLAQATAPVRLSGQDCRVTASLGVCLYPQDGADEATLMKHADVAMYQAKAEGKNTYRFYNDVHGRKTLNRLTLETHMRVAMERGEFSLNYQPKLHFRTDEITGVEALLRWDHPELGSVSPAEFIPVAEDTGLIVPIGRWVLQTACAQAMVWRRLGLPAVPMAVNLSPRQFADEGLYDDVVIALAESGLPANMLEIELTEGMVMLNVERAVQLLSSLKQLGVRVAIDDFGTGYSSLAQIRNFPIDTLKVDRCFVRGIDGDPGGQAIIEAIIAMGKTLSLTVIAEGVETDEEAGFLRGLACDEMQGYHFCRPMTGEALTRMMLSRPVAA